MAYCFILNVNFNIFTDNMDRIQHLDLFHAADHMLTQVWCPRCRLKSASRPSLLTSGTVVCLRCCWAERDDNRNSLLTFNVLFTSSVVVYQGQLTWEVDMDMWKNFPRPPCGTARVKNNLKPSLEKSGGSFCGEIHVFPSANVHLSSTSHTHIPRAVRVCVMRDSPVCEASCHFHLHVSENTPEDYCFPCDKVLYRQYNQSTCLIFSLI